MASPFLDAWIKGDEAGRQQGVANMQQLQLMGQLSELGRKQQEELAFRQEMAGAKTQEEAEQIAVRHGGAPAVLAYGAKQAQTAATKESALSRIHQSASQFDQMMDYRYRQAKDANEQRSVQNQWQQGRLNFQQAALRMTGEKLYDETGIRVGIPDVPQLGGQPAPAAGGAAQPDALAGRPQSELDAIALVQSGQAGSARATPEGAQIVRPAGTQYNPAGAPTIATAPVENNVPPTPAAQFGPEGRFPVIDKGPAFAPKAPQGAAPVAPAVPGQVPMSSVLPTVDEARRNSVTPSVAPSPAAAEPSTPPASTPGQIPPNVQAMIDGAKTNKEKRQISARWQLAEMNKEIKATVNMAGGRESMMTGRVLNGAEQASRALENIAAIPIENQSTGLFGGRGQDTGILNAGKETLANTMTTQDVQSYNVLATGFGRSLAAIETAGLGATNNLVHQMEGVIFKEGDTNLTKLKKLAEIRQIVEAGMETVNSNPRNAPETKEQAKRILARVEKAVPFTQMDIINLEKAQRVNPNTNLEQILGIKKGSAQTGGVDWNNPLLK